MALYFHSAMISVSLYECEELLCRKDFVCSENEKGQKGRSGPFLDSAF